MKIKPLTINQAYTGRRFKTQKYKDFEQELWYLLPNENIPQGKLELTIKIGVSTHNTDLDNYLKTFIDICQKKYLFNDNKIYRIIAEKEDVKKKEEYIKFNFKKYEPT